MARPAAGAWLEAHAKAATARLRSLAAHARRGRALRQGREEAGRELVPVDAIRSTRSGPTGRRRRSAPSPAPRALRARSPRPSSPTVREALKGVHGLVISDPHASPGCSTSAAPTCRHTPCRWASPCAARGRPTLYLDGRKLSNSVRDELESLAASRCRPAWPETSPLSARTLGGGHAALSTPPPRRPS